MKKLVNRIKYDKKVMTILNVISIAGIITGSLFIIILNKSDKMLIENTVQNYFNEVNKNSINLISNLQNIFLNNIGINIFIWLIGISVIGAIIVILVVFYKSFVLGFSISSLINIYSYKGIFIALVYVFPHMIINLLILLFISSYSLKLSIILIKSILKKESLNFKSFLHDYFKILILSFSFFIFTTLYESLIMPYILKIVLKIV